MKTFVSCPLYENERVGGRKDQSGCFLPFLDGRGGMVREIKESVDVEGKESICFLSLDLRTKANSRGHESMKYQGSKNHIMKLENRTPWGRASTKSKYDGGGLSKLKFAVTQKCSKVFSLHPFAPLSHLLGQITKHGEQLRKKRFQRKERGKILTH